MVSRYEQETIIVFNKEDELASIFTYERTWQVHLEKKLGLKPIMENGFGGKEYEIDKKRIKMPRVPVKLSAKQRKASSERMKRLRANQQNTFSLPKNPIDSLKI